MEDAARLSRRALALLRRPVAGLLAALCLGSGGLAGAVESPATEVAEALRSLGDPGVLWGRLALEEESPAGAWTPLNGVEVWVYPAVPALLAQVEHIRQSARNSGTEYDTAVARIQAVLAAYRVQVETVSGRSPSPAMSPGAAPAGPAALVRRQVTDPSGVFVFDDLPSGDWLLVAIRVTPYSQAGGRGDPGRPSTRDQRRGSGSGLARPFLPRVSEAAKSAELWLTPVRLVAGERRAVLLTDRARWLAGPIRGGASGAVAPQAPK